MESRREGARQSTNDDSSTRNDTLHADERERERERVMMMVVMVVVVVVI